MLSAKITIKQKQVTEFIQHWNQILFHSINVVMLCNLPQQDFEPYNKEYAYTECSSIAWPFKICTPFVIERKTFFFSLAVLLLLEDNTFQSSCSGCTAHLLLNSLNKRTGRTRTTSVPKEKIVGAAREAIRKGMRTLGPLVTPQGKSVPMNYWYFHGKLGWVSCDRKID